MSLAVRTLRSLLIVALLGAVALAECPAKVSPGGTMDPVMRRAILGSVWQTVVDSYLYPDLGGLSWDKELRRYRVLVSEAVDNAEFYFTVDEMIYRLGDQHSIYLAPWEACEEDRLGALPPEVGADGFDAVPAPFALRMGPEFEVIYLDLPSFDSLDIDELAHIELEGALEQGAPRGLILDLRSNYGGYLNSAYNLLTQFVSGRVGTEYDDLGTYDLDLAPGPLYFPLAKVPMVVLVDHDTTSAAEIVAAVLQDRGRATIIGQTTAGNTETVVPFDYIDGSRLWLAVGGFRLPDGSALEGRGVVPDTAVPTSDAVLDAALDHLLAR
jgi:C-terminal processing protease CtpA/Prc